MGKGPGLRIQPVGLGISCSPSPPPPQSYKMMCLWNCQLAKPQVRNKDHLCTTEPEVTSPAPINSTMARMEPRPWAQSPKPHCSALPQTRDGALECQEQWDYKRGKTESRLVRVGKGKVLTSTEARLPLRPPISCHPGSLSSGIPILDAPRMGKSRH